MKKCHICGHEKPYSRFPCDKDGMCMICRKLIKSRVIISPRVKVSPLVFHKGNTSPTCITCGKTKSISEFYDNSYECKTCNDYRHLLEKDKLDSRLLNIKCLVCGETKSVREFPYADFICKSCISRTNKLRKGQRYD